MEKVSIFVMMLVYLDVTMVSRAAKPDFKNLYPKTFTIPNNLGTGVSVAILVVEDTDAGVTAPTMTMTTNTYFELTTTGVLNGVIGNVVTSSSGNLAAATGTTQTLVVTTADDKDSKTENFDITIVNKAPVLSLPTTAVVSDVVNAETLVHTLTCTDVDAVTSALVSVTPSNSPKEEFFFVMPKPATTDYGVYARSQTTNSEGEFNYNTQISYVVRVRCTDAHGDIDTEDLTVYVQQNQAPVINNLPLATSTTVSSSTAAGTTVFTVTASDNENEAVTMTFACNPAGCPFTLSTASATTAVLTTTVDLTTLTPTSNLGYDITITPNDAKNTGKARVLTVLITAPNNVPEFVNLNNAWTVKENTAVGTTVFTVLTKDVDADTVTLSFTSNPTSGTSFFEMDASGNVKIKTALNYETMINKTYILTVLASDTKSTATGTLTISVVDVNEPFTWNSASYRVNVADGAVEGTTISVPGFGVTDPDAGETLTCRMTCVPDGYFSISTGCVISVSSAYSPDHGLANTVTCTVTGTDNDETNTATTTLTLDIVDANNYAPIFEESGFSFTISPYDGSGVTVGQVNATDADGGAFGQFTYSLNQTLTGTFFSVNSTTGVITTAVSMATCGCSGSTLVVPVYATDSGGRSATSTVYVTLGVTTTLAASATTERYKTFLEDSKNTAWFSVFLAAGAITAIVTGYVCFNYVFCKPAKGNIGNGGGRGAKGRTNRPVDRRRGRNGSNTTRL